MSANLVLVTVPSADEARAIARALVEARLAASANVLPGATSFYWWQGAVQEGGEALLLAKTRAALVDRLVDFVKARHSYVCPCVVALPISTGNPDYLAWLEEETAGA